MRINLKILIGIIVAVALVLWLYAGKDDAAKQAASTPVTSHHAVEESVGALGRIEPRSRVIRVSHDAGPEGARVGELNVAEGADISAGDVIAVFSDHPRKQAQRDAAQARVTMLEARIAAEASNVGFATKEFERHRLLMKDRAVSQAEYDAAERDYRQSQAQLRALKAEQESAIAEAKLSDEELRQSLLYAPLSGTVLKIHTWPGERVGDAGILEMADLSTLDVVAEIYERDMPRVRVGQRAQVSVPGMDGTFGGEVRELGFLVRKNDVNNTDPLSDRDNRVIEVRVSLEPKAAERLRNLLYLQVDVRLE